MIYRTRLVLFASALAFPLTAMSNPYPDRYRDDYRIYAANQALKNPIYLPPEHTSARSCIYIQQEDATAPSDYPLSELSPVPYRFSGSSEVGDPILRTSDSSLSAGSCISNPREHIALTLNNSTGHPENSDSDPDHSAEHSGRYSDETWADEARRERHPSVGEGFEHWHNSYDSGTLGEADFYSLYFEDVDSSRREAHGIRLVYGTYTPFKRDFNGGIVASASSLSGEVFLKRYEDEILFVSPYVLFSLGYGGMWWDYQRPIITNNGTKIEGELIEFIQLRAGIGFEVGRYGPIQLSVFGGADARIYLLRNQDELYNPLFEDSLAMAWGAALGTRF